MLKKIELLSPAGSPSCALAAFDAGADAIYAGLSKFNARERGENFSSDAMRKIVDYAHSLKRKVYLTLNTLVRETELPEVVEILAQLSEIAPDGVLVQDLGVLRIAREYFPDLELHASTQMGFHNHAGLEIAKQLGVSRVVLERQLTLEELSAIRKQTDLELEVFVHGALCCSLSGACLFSSYLGGWSGNRGKCKQPCRRRYFSKSGNGFFFSPQDLSTLELLPEFRRIGVDSLKVEGRLRQPDYVISVVKAYRMMLDAPETEFEERLPEARNLLSHGCGRRWSIGFYTSSSMKELIKSDAIGASGLRIGTVEAVRDNGFGFTAVKRVHLGDRVRIQPPSGDDGVAVTLTRIFAENLPVKYAIPGQRVFVCCDKEIPVNGIVYKIGESFADYSGRLAALPERRKALKLEVSLMQEKLAVKFLNAPLDAWEIPLSLKEAQKHPADAAMLKECFAESDSRELMLDPHSTFTVSGSWFLPASELKSLRRDFWDFVREKIDPESIVSTNGNSATLDRFCTDYLAMKGQSVTEAFLRETVAMKPNGAEPADRHAIRADGIFDFNKQTQEAILPEFCPESRLVALEKAVASAVNSGIRRFRVTSLFGLALLRPYRDLVITASAPLPICNSIAAAELVRFGVSRVMAHIEMTEKDILALRDKSPVAVECFRLGRPALLVSRAKIPFAGAFNDARGNAFELRFDHTSGLSRIFPVSVMSIPRIPGVYDFYDLRNANWKNNDTTTFNFDKEWL